MSQEIKKVGMSNARFIINIIHIILLSIFIAGFVYIGLEYKTILNKITDTAIDIAKNKKPTIQKMLDNYAETTIVNSANSPNVLALFDENSKIMTKINDNIETIINNANDKITEKMDQQSQQIISSLPGISTTL